MAPVKPNAAVIEDLIGRAGLRRRLYVLSMSFGKKRIKPETRQRQAEELVAACRQIVEEYDRIWPR